MNQRRHAPIRVVFVIAAVLAVPGVVSAGQGPHVGRFAAAYEEVLPEFERTTGITVTTTRGQSQGDVRTAIGAQLRRGVPADVVILSRGGLDGLIAKGLLLEALKHEFERLRERRSRTSG